MHKYKSRFRQRLEGYIPWSKGFISRFFLGTIVQGTVVPFKGAYEGFHIPRSSPWAWMEGCLLFHLVKLIFHPPTSDFPLFPILRANN